MMDFITGSLVYVGVFVAGLVACAVWLKVVPQLVAKIKSKASRDEE